MKCPTLPDKVTAVLTLQCQVTDVNVTVMAMTTQASIE